MEEVEKKKKRLTRFCEQFQWTNIFKQKLKKTDEIKMKAKLLFFLLNWIKYSLSAKGRFMI